MPATEPAERFLPEKVKDAVMQFLIEQLPDYGITVILVEPGGGQGDVLTNMAAEALATSIDKLRGQLDDFINESPHATPH